MTRQSIHVRELAAWGLDDYSYRPGAHRPNDPGAAPASAPRHPAPSSEAVLTHHTDAVRHLLQPQSLRPSLLEEMDGLQWSLGVIDLRALIAFQRRLFFDPTLPPPQIPSARDWESLVALAFPAATPPQCTTAHDPATGVITIQSANPNLHLRAGSDPSSPLRIHAGGPFFETASFRGRWFLRDGYHRAYALLRAGIHEVPSVVVRAETLRELGAVNPWFFPEDVLFSENPPYVSDFLNDAAVLTYDRPPLLKTIRITILESLTPATPTNAPTGDQP